jgi:hypothetical protein
MVFVALLVATLAFVAVSQAATTMVWVGGTQAPFIYQGQDPNNPGANDMQDPSFDNVDQVVRVLYPRTMGLLTFPYTTTYDDSRAQGVANTASTVVEVRNNGPTVTIMIVGLSQGGDVAGQAVHQLEDEGFDTSNIVLVLQGDIASNVGGLKTVLPFGYIPLIGMTLGQGTSITKTPTIQVRNQYDAAVDMPQFLNPFSLGNVFLALALYNTHTYTGTLNDPSYVVTTNESGLMTDIFRPYVGIVPLLRPLEMFGVPTALLQVLNQPVKDLIELGYDRSNYGVPGTYPDEPVRMTLLPPLHLLIPGLTKFFVDSLVAVQQLVAMAIPSVPVPALAGPNLTERNISPTSAASAVESSDPPVQVEPEPTQQPQERVLQNDSPTSTPPAIQPDKSEQPESIQSGVDAESTESKPVAKDSSSEETDKVDKKEPEEKDSSDPKVLNSGNKFEPGDTVQERVADVKDNDSEESPESGSDTPPSDNPPPSGASGGNDSSNSPGPSGASASSGSDNTEAAA